ncbi:MAG: polyprenyl synthetase family protein [Evtepia sp.]
MEFERRAVADRDMIEAALIAYLNQITPYGDLIDAMRYSLLSGGKRIRPILTLEACRMCGGAVEDALAFACAVEMIHTYSLIHDDLPCMDDDDYRRGRPTNHRVHGEATALLAGDALLTEAFSMIATVADPVQVTAAVRCLAGAIGANGMVAGQILDMAGEGRALSFADVKEIEALKTGALIVASVQLGVIAANGSEEQKTALTAYATRLGLAFQVQDDILDVEGNAARLGKPIGSDVVSEKATFAFLKGVDTCKVMVKELTEQAIDALKAYEESAFLCQLATRLAARDK